MKSIDNLREYALTAASVNATTRAVLAGYIDGIEREVEELRDRDYRNGREDAEGAVEFVDRLCRASERREDVTLWGVDYTPLPVDADGVPIHVGDVLDSKVDYLFDGKPFTVRALVLCEDGWEVGDGRFGNRYEPDSLHHHHAPTVEDVLREFYVYAERGKEHHREDVDDAVLAEYAEKLRLAESE